MPIPNSTYWKARAAKRMETYLRDSQETVETVGKAYDKAMDNINKEMQRIYATYLDESGLKPAEIRKILNQAEDPKVLRQLRRDILSVKDPTVRKAMMNRINAQSVRSALSRLQVMKDRIRLECMKAASVQLTETKRGLIRTIDSAYMRTVFDIQKGLNLSYDFAGINNRQIQEILKNPWSGKSFSQRVWCNVDTLAQRLTDIVPGGMLSGRSAARMATEVQDLSNIGRFAAERIIRTETNFVANRAERTAYEEAGVEKYQYEATLDNRTSRVCQDLDGKVFPLEKARPGKNAPPMHPYCRSTTIAVFDEEIVSDLQRRAKDPLTGAIQTVPASTTYKAWRSGQNSPSPARTPTRRRPRKAVTPVQPPAVNPKQIPMAVPKPPPPIQTPVQSQSSTPIPVQAVPPPVVNPIPQPAVQPAPVIPAEPAYIGEIEKTYMSWKGFNRNKLAKDILSMKGLAHVDVESKSMSSFGSCMFGGDPIRVIRMSLKSNDPRADHYKVKTVFHELYHALMDGQPFYVGRNMISKAGESAIEETFAECSAHFFIKRLTGIGDLSPSYSEHLARLLPRLKKHPEFAHCSTIPEFGEVMARYRWDPAHRTTDYRALDRFLSTVQHDDAAHAMQYLQYIRTNRSSIVDKILENSPENAWAKKMIEGDLDFSLSSLETSGRMPPDKMGLLSHALIIAMNRVGVK